MFDRTPSSSAARPARVAGPRRLPGLAAVAGLLAIALAVTGCAPEIRGHGEIGSADGSLTLGSIAPADGGSGVRVELAVTSGVAQLDVVAADGSVAWTARANPAEPIDAAVPALAGPGPWEARLVAVEAPLRADYRIGTR